MSKRKAFNFYFSYYDSAKLLSDSERLKFYDAVMEKQFYGVDPKGLKGSVLLAYTGQKHSIEAQVKGWMDKTGESLQCTENYTTEHPTDGGIKGGWQQEEVQEKGEEKEKEKLVFPFEGEEFLKIWEVLLTQRKWRKKSFTALQASLKKLSAFSEEVAIKMIENTIAGEWQGLFELKENFQKNKPGGGAEKFKTHFDIVNEAEENLKRKYANE